MPNGRSVPEEGGSLREGAASLGMRGLRGMRRDRGAEPVAALGVIAELVEARARRRKEDGVTGPRDPDGAPELGISGGGDREEDVEDRYVQVSE